MHFWGLTIDVISCVNLVIAVGLCVDYSAHIAHTFIVTQKGIKHGLLIKNQPVNPFFNLPVGSLQDRALSTLGSIGPAVLNGGFSTFLAFVMTARSESHVFLTFFKVIINKASFQMGKSDNSDIFSF